MSRIPKIVILGAGYGGLMTAQHLEKKLNYNEADITLVNKHTYHYVTTHLHMPAAGTDKAENARIELSELIDEQKINFIKGTVKEIKPDEKKVLLEDGTVLSYDYLVVGVGGEPETYGIQGLIEHAFSIRSINSVRLIREHIEYQFAKFKLEPDRLDYVTFVVGGAGFTGIEFVGELADRVPVLCKQFDVDPSLVKIYTVEAAPTALPPGFPKELVEYAIDVLTNKGVEFKFSTAIKECTPEGVLLANDEFIRSQTVVWTGGVRGNRLLEQSGFETSRGRVVVDEYLRSKQYEDVFIVGDCSIVLSPEGRPYPPTAQISTQQGKNCAANLVALLRGGSMKPFVFRSRGTVASLGKDEAVGYIGKTLLKGPTAAFMKKVIDNRYLYMIGGLPVVVRKGRFFN